MALATDCNPGSSFTTSMPFCIALAVREMHMTPDEAVWSATAGGARALRRTDIGHLGAGAKADVLLLDEPSAGLSPVKQDETFLRVHEINRAGVSVIMVEQNARRCLQICDRGYVLDQGRNAYTATGRQLANDPRVIELYLGTLARVK